MDNVQEAKELVKNYKHAIAYLDSVSEWTCENFRHAIHLSGNPVPESEIRQQWEMAKMTLQGTESLRQVYREVWQKGIEVFSQVASELPKDVDENPQNRKKPGEGAMSFYKNGGQEPPE